MLCWNARARSSEMAPDRAEAEQALWHRWRDHNGGGNQGHPRDWQPGPRVRDGRIAPAKMASNAPAPTGAEVSFRSARVVAFRRRPFRPLAAGARHDRAKQQARFDQCATDSEWRCFGCPRREIRADTAGVPPRAAGGPKGYAEAKASGRCARCCCPGGSPRVRHPVGRGDAQHRLHGRRLRERARDVCCAPRGGTDFPRSGG